MLNFWDKYHSKIVGGLISLLLLSSAGASDRIIIKFKPTPQQRGLISTPAGIESLRVQQMQPLESKVLNALATSAGVKLEDVSAVAVGARVLQIKQDLSPAQLEEVLKKLRNRPEVEYVGVDSLIYPMSIKGMLNQLQWDMTAKSTSLGDYSGSNFTGADGISGVGIDPSYGESIVVAVIDTGYTPHPNLLSQFQAFNHAPPQVYGYQFISDCVKAGDCRTNPKGLPVANALDLGDFTRDYSSSWHGTHVSGTISASGADTIVNGAPGVTGGAPAATIVPVRVLGRDGGYRSDVINGMMWAGGYSVPKAQVNPVPARILNLSLGGYGKCSLLMQDTINQLVQHNVIVVASAGNDIADFKDTEPANCAGVISVAAVGPTQALSFYSNFGQVTIAAPGGDSKFEHGKIYSTACSNVQANNSCNFSNELGFSFVSYQGTSMAAPHVVAAIAALLSLHPQLTKDQVINLLRSSATPFDQEHHCNRYGCLASGVGMLNVAQLLKAANQENNLRQ
jgi:serine protease